MKTPTYVLCTLFLATGLWAQQAPAAVPATPVSQPSTDDRIKALEAKILALESEVQDLKSTQAAQTAALSAAAAPVEAAPAPEPAPTPVLGGATSMAKALNPDISLIGNFLGSAGHNPIDPSPSLEMRESELGIQAIVDPYARADVFLSFGETGVNLEEGFLTFTSLPAGFVAKVGKMRADFGKVNTLHTHVLPWTDRPLVTGNLVGGEDGIDDAGFSITRAFAGPKNLFLEATGQVFRGDSSDVFAHSRNSDVSTVAHLRGYKDLSDSTNVDIGMSYARGNNDGGLQRTTSLYGVDATFRWKPLRRAIYHSFIGRSEFVWSQRQQLPAMQRAFGYYVSGDYQFARRWFAGARFDWSDRAANASQTDRGGSLILTYWPSEFAQLRGQYRFTRYAENIDTNELRFQLQFVMGAHGAHPF